MNGVDMGGPTKNLEPARDRSGKPGLTSRTEDPCEHPLDGVGTADAVYPAQQVVARAGICPRVFDAPKVAAEVSNPCAEVDRVAFLADRVKD